MNHKGIKLNDNKETRTSLEGYLYYNMYSNTELDIYFHKRTLELYYENKEDLEKDLQRIDEYLNIKK